MIKATLTVIFKILTLIGLIFILGSFLSLLDIPFFTRWDNWAKHPSEKSFEMIKDGIIFIIISILYFSYIEPKIFKRSSLSKIQYSKCPRCKEVFNYNELEKGKCKYCKDIETIELEEYYKKYPEELEEK